MCRINKSFKLFHNNLICIISLSPSLSPLPTSPSFHLSSFLSPSPPACLLETWETQEQDQRHLSPPRGRLLWGQGSEGGQHSSSLPSAPPLPAFNQCSWLVATHRRVVEDPGWWPAAVIYGWVIWGQLPHPTEPLIPHLQNETHWICPASPPWVVERFPQCLREWYENVGKQESSI